MNGDSWIGLNLSACTLITNIISRRMIKGINSKDHDTQCVTGLTRVLRDTTAGVSWA